MSHTSSVVSARINTMSPRITLAIVVIALYCGWVKAQQGTEVQLNKPTSKIRGFRNNVGGYDEFLGIKYGIYHQFQRANETPAWSSVQDATTRYPCPQTYDLFQQDYTQKDDLDGFPLTLDVYSKVVGQVNKQPVVVYLPGGQFFANANSKYYGPKYLMDANYIVVIVNYRVGVYGFLSALDKELPGNLGLWDQQLALKWINDNIEKFGGDKDQVTLFGHDSGAVSVAIHAFNDESKKYFQRAIISGGSIYNPWAFQQYEPWRARNELARKLSCSTTTRDLIECLRTKDIRDVLKVQSELSRATFVPILDTNFTDNPFFKKDPRIELDNGNYIEKPIIFGMTKNAGAIHFFRILNELKRENNPLITYFKHQLFPFTRRNASMSAVQTHQLESVIKGIKYLYFKDVEPSSWAESITHWIEVLSDYEFKSGVDMMARKWGKKQSQNTYMYDLENESPTSWGALAYGEQGYQKYAPTHMDDVFYFFNCSYFEEKVKESYEMMQYRTAFSTPWKQFITKGSMKDVQLPGNPSRPWIPFSGNYTTLRIMNKTEPQTNQFRQESQYRSAKLEYFSVMVRELLWSNQQFYDHQEVNEHYKSSTWGLLAAFLILILICIVLLIINLRKKKQGQKYNAGFSKVGTHDRSEGVEFQGV